MWLIGIIYHCRQAHCFRFHLCQGNHRIRSIRYWSLSTGWLRDQIIISGIYVTSRGFMQAVDAVQNAGMVGGWVTTISPIWCTTRMILSSRALHPSWPYKFIKIIFWRREHSYHKVLLPLLSIKLCHPSQVENKIVDDNFKLPSLSDTLPLPLKSWSSTVVPAQTVLVKQKNTVTINKI